MKKKELNDLKIKSVHEITSQVKNLEKEKTNTQLELKMGRNKNVHQLNQLKKSIAQALTFIRLKEIVGESKSKDGTVKRRVNATG